jgi:hypothetical protein
MTHHPDSIEILADGVSNRPSAAEIERRATPDVMSDHELYELINSPDEQHEDMTADAVRRLYFGLLDIQRGIFNELRLKVSNVRTVPDAVRTIDTFALALGFTTVCGASNSAELARKWGRPKETVNKPLLEIIEKFNLPKLPGARSEEAKNKMADARRSHIKTK